MKLTRILPILLVIMILFTGCTKTPEPVDIPTSAKPDNTPVNTATAVPVPTPSANNTDNYIKTPGGAVLVGKVGKNADGEYGLTLDTPVTVELNYFLDHPEYFNDITFIRFYDMDVDDIDKTAYDGMDVTIKGILENPRSAGTLYVHVVYISAEREVEKCYADESITIDYDPGFKPEYDPTIPLPEKVLPKTENGVYVFNPYALNVNTVKVLGNDFCDWYITFVDAFLSYKTSCACPVEYYADMLPLMMFSDFYMFDGDGILGDVITYDETTQTVNWTYAKDKAAHDKMIKNYTAEVNKYLKLVSSSANEFERAKAVYHALSTSMTYDYSLLETRQNTTAYYGFTTHRGICVTFARCLDQLFTQVGIADKLVSCSLIVGEGENESGHDWNLASIDGKYYFFDATYEAGTAKGKGYTYFGFTMTERMADGSAWDKDSMMIGSYKLEKLTDVTIADKRLNVK